MTVDSEILTASYIIPSLVTLLYKYQALPLFPIQSPTILTMLSTVTVSLLSLSLVSPTPLESLLRPHITSAQCVARCQDVEDSQGEGSVCHQVCQLLLSSHTTSPICSLPHLCVGGCRTACSQEWEANEKVRSHTLVTPHLTPCSLSWSLDPPAPRTVYLVAGRDHGGMWHLVSGSLTVPSVPLTAISRYPSVRILAVSPHGLVGQTTVSLGPIPTLPCTMEELPRPSTSHHTQGWSSIDLTYILMPGSLILLCLLSLALVLVYRMRSQDPPSTSQLEDQDRGEGAGNQAALLPGTIDLPPVYEEIDWPATSWVPGLSPQPEDLTC